MLTRVAHVVTNHAKAVVITAVMLFAVSAALGGGVAEHLISGGFDDPDSESFQAAEVLEDQFGGGVPDVVLMVTAVEGSVDDPAAAEAGAALTEELAAHDDLTGVISYWSEDQAPPLRSDDGTRALVLGRIDVDTDSEQIERIEELRPTLRSDGPDVEVEVGGFAEVFSQVNTTIEDDLLTAEMIAIPLTLLLLVLIFGSVVAASLPIMVGAMSVIGTFLVLRILAEVTDVSIFALNLTTSMGLGLAIDYSLFVVSRFREELRSGHEPGAAVERTVLTAGRTVAFSALTVAASLCALLVFPLAFLRSFAYAGVAVAALAGVFSVVVLPAVLRLLGQRVNSLTVRRRSVEGGGTFWYRAARFVMRRPVPIATGVIVVLLFMLTPFLGLNLSLPDDRVLPEGSQGREVGDILRDEFSSREAGALSIVATSGLTPSGVTADAGDQELEAYAAQLAELPSVARVDSSSGTHCGEGLSDQLGCEAGELVLPANGEDRYNRFTANGGTYLSVVPSVEPMSDAGEDLVHDVRSTPAPVPVEVTGDSAELVDSKDSLLARLPVALGIIALITFVLLFMMFGSVVIPLKAIVLNLLSLSAMFGAMVWVFQDGNLSGVLDFTATGGLTAAMPILMFCVAFGLSMDYEVFLLSRIKEEHDAGSTNEDSVARGLQRTGRIVTAAATLMAVIFMAFAFTGSVSFIKMFGIGLTLAVLLDAFVIRGTLVPAFMRLAGEWNWWAPRPMKRFYDRWGISESTSATREATIDPAGADDHGVATDQNGERETAGGSGQTGRPGDESDSTHDDRRSIP